MAHVVEHIIDTVGSDVVLMCGAKVGVEPRKLNMAVCGGTGEGGGGGVVGMAAAKEVAAKEVVVKEVVAMVAVARAEEVLEVVGGRRR